MAMWPSSSLDRGRSRILPSLTSTSGVRCSPSSRKLLAYLSSDEYQLGLIKVGLWLPSHTSLLTPEGIASWMTPDVHPEGYDLIVTDYLKNYGHNLFYPAGFAEADSLITSALDPVWIGEQTAEEALVASGVLEEIEAHLQEQQALLA